MNKFVKNVLQSIEEYKRKSDIAEQLVKEKDVQIIDVTAKWEELQHLFNKSSQTDRPTKCRKNDSKK